MFIVNNRQLLLYMKKKKKANEKKSLFKTIQEKILKTTIYRLWLL